MTVDINSEVAIYQHIHKMAFEISDLIRTCKDRELAGKVSKKCDSIANVLYYLDDIIGWRQRAENLLTPNKIAKGLKI
jgi:hypothetical protein